MLSHAGCSAIGAEQNNVSDDQMRAVAAAGGIIGVIALPHMIADRDWTVGGILDHVEHAIAVMGEEAVALGGDFTYQLFRAGALPRLLKDTDMPDGVTLASAVEGLRGPGGLPRARRRHDRARLELEPNERGAARKRAPLPRIGASRWLRIRDRRSGDRAGGERTLDEIVGVARVPARGDPAIAVVRVPEAVAISEVECDVLVVGGGTGGVAAALAAARRGQRVYLLEETDWLGGQLTAQGVSALDEHDLIERSAAPRATTRCARRSGARYGDARPASRRRRQPGNCWVSRLAFEPAAGVEPHRSGCSPPRRVGPSAIHRRMKPVAVAGRRRSHPTS